MNILYVDDDADDREFFKGAIKEADPPVEVILAENGLEALHYLNASKHSKLPNLIVLDINMPYLDGKETLSRIKKDAALEKVPVAFLSSSERPRDKALFNSLGIEYFIKPLNEKYLKNIADHLITNYCKQ